MGQDFLEKYRLPLYCGLGGLVLVAFGFFLFSIGKQEQIQVEVIPAEEEAAVVMVDLEGAVERPGVYELESGARLNDLLIKAGGLGAEADRAWVTQNLNLATELHDGQKVWIPKVGQAQILEGASTLAGNVNINTATSDQLEQLSGIGSARAEAIVSNRPYSTVEELVAKKVIPQSVFEKIKEKITAY